MQFAKQRELDELRASFSKAFPYSKNLNQAEAFWIFDQLVAKAIIVTVEKVIYIRKGRGTPAVVQKWLSMWTVNNRVREAAAASRTPEIAAPETTQPVTSNAVAHPIPAKPGPLSETIKNPATNPTARPSPPIDPVSGKPIIGLAIILDRIAALEKQAARIPELEARIASLETYGGRRMYAGASVRPSNMSDSSVSGRHRPAGYDSLASPNDHSPARPKFDVRPSSSSSTSHEEPSESLVDLYKEVCQRFADLNLEPIKEDLEGEGSEKQFQWELSSVKVGEIGFSYYKRRSGNIVVIVDYTKIHPELGLRGNAIVFQSGPKYIQGIQPNYSPAKYGEVKACLNYVLGHLRPKERY